MGVSGVKWGCVFDYEEWAVVWCLNRLKNKDRTPWGGAVLVAFEHAKSKGVI